MSVHVQSTLRQRSDIDATALFYSDCDLTSEAEFSIRSALEYPTTNIGGRHE